MTITITPTRLRGAITPPPSKSQAHRLLIAAALAEGESHITNLSYSQDILATLSCLEQLSAKIVREESAVRIQGLRPQHTGTLPHLDCRESGSTLRFMIPVALAAAGGGRFTGAGRLLERPQGPFQTLFSEKGIAFDGLADSLARRAKAVVLNGATKGTMLDAIKKNKDCAALEVHVSDTLGEAIERVREIAKAGDVVLLSPAATSFDQFKNFEERGEFFKSTVLSWTREEN